MSQHETNVPEPTLCFVKINLNIFAVCYKELYKNRVSPVVPLGSCWMPVKNRRHPNISTETGKNRIVCTKHTYIW